MAASGRSQRGHRAAGTVSCVMIAYVCCMCLVLSCIESEKSSGLENLHPHERFRSGLLAISLISTGHSPPSVTMRAGLIVFGAICAVATVVTAKSPAVNNLRGVLSQPGPLTWGADGHMITAAIATAVRPKMFSLFSACLRGCSRCPARVFLCSWRCLCCPRACCCFHRVADVNAWLKLLRLSRSVVIAHSS